MRLECTNPRQGTTLGPFNTLLGDMAEVFDANEDIDDVLADPWGTQANTEVVRRQPNCGLPALARDRDLTPGISGVACEVDEDQGGIDTVQLPQEVEVRQPVGVLVEAPRPVCL